MKIKNIQTRLLLSLVPLIFLIVGVLSGVSYYLSQQTLAKSIGQTAMAVGTDFANQVQADMELLVARLEDLASIQPVRAPADKAQLVGAMAEAQKRLGVFDAIIFIQPDGRGHTSLGTTANYSDRAYFKQVLATRKPVVSEPAISRSTGKLAVMLAMPVIDVGQLKGVLVGTSSVDRFTAMIKNLKFLETGYGLLAIASGTVIANPVHPEMTGKLNLRDKKLHPDLKAPQNELDDRLVAHFTKAVESGIQARGEYTYLDGVARVAVFTPIDLPGDQRWIMLVTAPKAEAARETASLAKTMLAVSLLFLLLAAIAAVVMAKKFAQPITIIRDDCLLLAQGDLRDTAAQVTTEDEIGQLARGFHDMRTNLRAFVRKVQSQADQVAAASEELTASAEQSRQGAGQIAAAITEVTTGTEKQLTALDEVAAAVNQMSAGIGNIAANANGVAGTSAQSAQVAQEGSKAVEKAIRQMTSIEGTVTRSAGVVSKLGERSKEIGQIVDTIAGIAGQTNLLALNAAIEAARAGEQGRGFAVVAEEVRKLAEQAQEAAKQIAELIAEIRQDTDSAVAAMDAGTKEVRVGTEVVNDAGRAFRDIFTSVSEVSAQIEGISAAIQQMAGGSKLVVSSVRDIDTVSRDTASQAQTVSAATQEQSATTEEIATSSQALARMAEELTEAVSRFRI